MWTKEVSTKTRASKAQIWEVWTDVSDWKLWDNQVIESSVRGEFITGATGLLTPKGGPKSTFELIEVTNEKSFTSRAKLPLAKMDFIHFMTQSDGELFVTHRIEISGLLTFVFSRVIGRKIISELPEALHNLLRLAEKK